jgi:hypothetical protein
LGIRETLSSAFIRGTEPKRWQTNPWDLDAEMITRLPVATAKDHHNLFMARLITTRPLRLANEATCAESRLETPSAPLATTFELGRRFDIEVLRP